MPQSFDGIPEAQLPPHVNLYRGKVRDVLDLGSSMVLVTSDRISAFDCSLGCVPGKGEILNQLSLFWFYKTKDLVPNHIIKEVSSRAVKVKKARVIPLEMIVRGYLTGSAWRDYSNGGVHGQVLPAGLTANCKFDQPLITPTTKAENGKHDAPISRQEILEQGLVSQKLWEQIVSYSLALFNRGTEILRERGLILVDTKYEFGLVDDQLIVVDEIHTMDSSRFWFAEDYEKARAENRPPRQLDKEFLRTWLMDQGFQGDGPSPSIPPQVLEEVLSRYKETFQLITGQNFTEQSHGIEVETRKILSSLIEG